VIHTPPELEPVDGRDCGGGASGLLIKSKMVTRIVTKSLTDH